MCELLCNIFPTLEIEKLHNLEILTVYFYKVKENNINHNRISFNKTMIIFTRRDKRKYIIFGIQM